MDVMIRQLIATTPRTYISIININQFMRSSPLWDVTQRGLVATDVLRKVMDT